MKIEIEDSLNHLNSYPELAKEKLLKVFSLIESEIYLSPADVYETVEIGIESEKFYGEKLTDGDIVNILELMKNDFGFVENWKRLSKTKEFGKGFGIYIPCDQLERFRKFGKILEEEIKKYKNNIENKGLKIVNEISGFPEFTEMPPQIIWGDIIIPIPPASIQFCVCKVLFAKELGEVVSWDEVAEEFDGDDSQETSWRAVYDAVRLVNKKVKDKTGKIIFKTHRKSFSMIT